MTDDVFIIIIKLVGLAIYDVVGIVLIGWAIYSLWQMRKGGR